MTAGLAEDVEKGQTEVLGLVGVYSDGGGGVFGGGIQYGIKSRWLFAGEFGYLTGGEDVKLPGVKYDSSIWAIDGNVHYLFPLKNNEKLTPYALGGLGIFRSSGSSQVTGLPKISASDTDFGVNIGGGVRYAVGTNWGVRPELKIFLSNNTNVRYSLGVYYRFGK
jgi:opacity protein-like surface antigen